MGVYLMEESPEYPDRSEGEPGNRDEKVLVQKTTQEWIGRPGIRPKQKARQSFY